EGRMHPGLLEAPRPREQAYVPVAAPAAAPPLASQVHVLEADAVGWVCRGCEHLPELAPQRLRDPLVGVEREDPFVPRGRDRGIPLTSERPARHFDDGDPALPGECPPVVR